MQMSISLSIYPSVPVCMYVAVGTFKKRCFRLCTQRYIHEHEVEAEVRKFCQFIGRWKGKKKTRDVFSRCIILLFHMLRWNVGIELGR